jgi:hypothetical protein
MPPKPELPIKNLNLLKKCHDDKIRSLVALIQKIFNTTDESLGISATVTNAIQKLHPIPGTNKELSKSNLKNTNELIKNLQDTVGKNEAGGLTASYKQVVKAIVEYARKIKCPETKSETDFNEFEKMINDLYFLEKKYREYYRSNNNQCKTDDCKVPTLNGLTIQQTPQYQKFLKLYRTKPYNNNNWLKNFKNFLTSYRYGDYKERDFSSRGRGLIPQLTIINSRLNENKNKKRKQRGGSKHHKTKTTKKRIKGKQPRRNKVKNKTTIKAKNKTKKR